MNDTTRLPPEGFGQPADEWHASQGPYLDDLTAAERRAAKVKVRCEGCRDVIAVLTADGFLVTRSRRRARPKRRAHSTYDNLLRADCGCAATEPRRDAEGFTIERVWAELPGAAKAQETLLLERLRAAMTHYARGVDGAEELSADFAANLTKKRAVCGKLAILHKLWSPTAEPFGSEVGDLGRQLQLALSLKNAVSVPGDTEATRRRILREVGAAVREWEAAGAVAADQRSVLMQQFQRMMRGFAE